MNLVYRNSVKFLNSPVFTLYSKRRYPTTAETDAALLAAGGLPPRLRAAVSSRLERKQLLAAGEALLAAYAQRL